MSKKLNISANHNSTHAASSNVDAASQPIGMGDISFLGGFIPSDIERQIFNSTPQSLSPSTRQPSFFSLPPSAVNFEDRSIVNVRHCSKKNENSFAGIGR